MESRKKDDPVAEAKRLGISYGTYIGYRDSGYLKTWERVHNKRVIEESRMANVVESYIGGGKDKVGKNIEHCISKDKKGEEYVFR